MTVPQTAPATSAMSARRFTMFAAVVGIVSALVTLAVAAVLALFLGATNPVLSVGSLVIDLAPPWVKDFAIALFGTGDKVFLLVVLGVVILAAAVAVGILESRRPPFGVTLLLLIALVALVAAVTRANATYLDAVPTIVGAIAGTLVLRRLMPRLVAWRRATAGKRPAAPIPERRSFLQLALGLGITSLLVGAGASLVSGASTAVSAARTRIKLPTPATPGPTIPAGADLGITGLSPYITSNANFYRIDTALQVPSIDPKTWTLKVGGMVENEITLTFAELEKLPLKEKLVTLACVSQEVGGNLISNALWLGYPIRELLARAKPTAGADMVLSTSIDGFTAGTPLASLQDETVDALLAIGMNGTALPLEHGFPVRMVVPGLYGYVSATKWVVDLKVTTFAKDQGYWTPRGWSAHGPVKLSSRIDTPTQGRTLSAGTIAVAGVAWDQEVGIRGVQVRVDSGAWQDARLATAVSVDTWLQWVYEWDATPGAHRLTVRAINSNGEVQTSAIADPPPNGSTGLHSIGVTIN